MQITYFSKSSSALASFVISLVMMGWQSEALAQVAVAPSAPKAQDQVHLQVPQGQIGTPTVSFRDSSGGFYNTYNPRATQVSMDGNQITVVVQLLDNGFGNPSQGMDLPLGEFPAGTYGVQLLRQLPDGTSAGTVGTTQFTVSARANADPLWNHTDMWWNPNESGWGLSVTQHGSGVLFGAWFVYGADNKPIWYVIPGGTWNSPTEFRGAVYKTTGPYFGAATFDPTAVNVTLAGNARIAFDGYDSNSATIVLNVDGVALTKSLKRQPF